MLVRSRRRRGLGGLVVAQLIFAAPGATSETSTVALSTTSKQALARVDRLLRGYAEAQTFSGEVLIARGEQVILHRRYGHADWARGTSLPDDGIYKIGSLTKQFTAAAILRLQAQGRLKTEDPIGKHLPELDEAVVRPDGRPITLHHLLHHSSGVPNVDYGNQLGPEVPFSDVAAALEGATPQHAPGAEYRYSNVGFILLGEVIRRASGLSYEGFLRREFFDPLHMPATGIKPDGAQRARFVPGHIWTGLGLRPSNDVFGPHVAHNYEWDLAAGGSVFSTVTDMATWIRALAEGRVLGAAAMDELLDPGHGDYACGWVVKEDPRQPGNRLVWHNGAVSPFGYKADASWSPESDLIVVILSNIDSSSIEKKVHANVRRALAGQAPLTPTTSFGVMNAFAFVAWTQLHLVAVLLSTIWILLLRKQKSRLYLLGAVVSQLALTFFAAAVLPGWPAVLAGVLCTLVAAGAARRGRALPWAHGSTLRMIGDTALNVGAAVFLVWMGVAVFPA